MLQLDGPRRESPEKFPENPGRAPGHQRVSFGPPNVGHPSCKCGALWSHVVKEFTQGRKRDKSLLNTPQRCGRQAGQQRRDSKGSGERPQLQGEVREYGKNGIFSSLVILGTVRGYNWSVRACGYFEVGRSMNLFELPVCFQLLGLGCRGPFYLDQVSIAQPCSLKAASTISAFSQNNP